MAGTNLNEGATALDSYLVGCARNGRDDGEPAVVVNPRASLHQVLGWCHAEVQSLVAVSQTFSEIAGQETVEMGAIGPMFLHRLEPLKAALEHVQARVHAEGQA